MSTTTHPDRYDTGSLAWAAHEAANGRADREAEYGPRLWDATPGVCCAAFQLGACPHTEGPDDDYDMPDAEVAEALAIEQAQLRLLAAITAPDTSPF
jgi:hypothetical protein